jgi:hypothetical protein
MKKSVKLAGHVLLLNSNIAIGFFVDIPNIARIFCDGEPILAVISNIGEAEQYRCFK